jgi:DNA-binding response OmpR family regulator
MALQRILLVDREGPYREALARVLSGEGHDVRVADPGEAGDRLRELEPDAVIGHAEVLREVGQLEGVRRVTLARPVSMEELRRTLRGR